MLKYKPLLRYDRFIAVQTIFITVISCLKHTRVIQISQKVSKMSFQNRITRFVSHTVDVYFAWGYWYVGPHYAWSYIRKIEINYRISSLLCLAKKNVIIRIFLAVSRMFESLLISFTCKIDGGKTISVRFVLTV